VLSSDFSFSKFRQLTIAQIVHDNERYFGLSEMDIHDKVFNCLDISAVTTWLPVNV